mmetsp:Transcript_3219/g.14400  ORF Transcript_3219/g.14400 Transcript_3219/m.14400 type:complete len:204 (+) Transcript_3219:988-1599(+)
MANTSTRGTSGRRSRRANPSPTRTSTTRRARACRTRTRTGSWSRTGSCPRARASRTSNGATIRWTSPTPTFPTRTNPKRLPRRARRIRAGSGTEPSRGSCSGPSRRDDDTSRWSSRASWTERLLSTSPRVGRPRLIPPSTNPGRAETCSERSRRFGSVPGPGPPSACTTRRSPSTRSDQTPRTAATTANALARNEGLNSRMSS